MMSMIVSHLRLQRYAFFSIRQVFFFKKNQNFGKSLIVSDLFFYYNRNFFLTFATQFKNNTYGT